MINTIYFHKNKNFIIIINIINLDKYKNYIIKINQLVQNILYLSIK